MRAYLKGGAFQLDFAENGKIAVEKVISGHPDLVLMDLQMPVMDGLEATRAIRQWEAETRARPIPILALTAHAAARRGRQEPEGRMYRAPYQTYQEGDASGGHRPPPQRKNPHHSAPRVLKVWFRDIWRTSAATLNEILASGDPKDCNIARRLGHQFKGRVKVTGFPKSRAPARRWNWLL